MRWHWATIGVAVILTVQRAWADHCSPQEYDHQSRASYYVATSWQFARYANPRYQGHFEGTALEVGYRYAGFLVASQLPAYRLTRNGIATVGLGDVTLVLQQDLWTDAAATNALGLRLGVTGPTGDATRDLGMGHAMLMPSVVTRFRLGRISGQFDLEYARAVKGPKAHHHAHASTYFPIVQPMNASEISGSLVVALDLALGLALRSRAVAASPLWADGNSRAVLGIGAALQHQRVATFLEVQKPIVGAPFTARAMGGLLLRF